MTDAEIPVGRQAVRAWKRLDADVRKDVWRRARQGLGHPDPALAALAVGQARYLQSLGFSVPFWSGLFILITGIGVGLLAVLDRLTRLDPIDYVIVVGISLLNGVTSYTRFCRQANQLEKANLNRLSADHTDAGSPD